MRCLFCPETDGLTKEHVFPAFLGCKLSVPNCSCKKCQKTSSDFESVFANQTETSRQTFQIPNRYGVVPDAPVKIDVNGVDDLGELQGWRKPTGKLVFQPRVRELPVENGKKVTRGVFVDDEKGAENFVTRRRARGETITDSDWQLLPKNVIVQAVSNQSLQFAFMPEARRTAAKCALVALAHQYGVDYARSSQFDALRSAIMNPAEPLAVNIFANRDFKEACLRSPCHHSVIAYLSAGMRKAWAAVTFFGGVSYIVELSDCFDEPQSRQFMLFYDAETQQVFNPVVLHSEQELIGRVLSPSTVFNDQHAVDDQWFSIVDGYCRSKGYELARVRPGEDSPDDSRAPKK